mgnify:CR=1 FL=1
MSQDRTTFLAANGTISPLIHSVPLVAHTFPQSESGRDLSARKVFLRCKSLCFADVYADKKKGLPVSLGRAQRLCYRVNGQDSTSRSARATKVSFVARLSRTGKPQRLTKPGGVDLVIAARERIRH